MSPFKKSPQAILQTRTVHIAWLCWLPLLLLSSCSSEDRIDLAPLTELGVEVGPDAKLLAGIERPGFSSTNKETSKTDKHESLLRSRIWVVVSSSRPQHPLPNEERQPQRLGDKASVVVQSQAFTIQVLADTALALGVSPTELDWLNVSEGENQQPLGEIVEWEAEGWEVRIRYISNNDRWLSVIEAIEVSQID